MAVLSKVTAPNQPHLGDLPTLPTPGSPHVRKKPWRRTGPKNLKLGVEPAHISGPGIMPDAFNTGKSSQGEWVLYWAFCKVHHTGDPHQQPFEGDHGSPPKWAYQKYTSIVGVTGKTNLDFVVYENANKNSMIGVRLESERFHIEADPIQKALDEWLVIHTYGIRKIINVYEQHFMAGGNGGNGQAACIVVAQASKGIQLAGPLTLGNYYRIR